MAIKAANLKGKVFGRLTVLEREPLNRRGTFWITLCSCGELKPIRATDLNNGCTQSCGCLQRETISKIRSKHGMSDTPTHIVWKSMKGRCLNVNDSRYHRYGGRGITVCDKWLNNFKAFYADMGERPEGLTLDRIDNNGDYTPENCRWATNLEQCNNQERNRVISAYGLTKTISQWSRLLSISRGTLNSRAMAGDSATRIVREVRLYKKETKND